MHGLPRKSFLALTILASFSLFAQEENAASQDIEEVTVVAKKLSHANQVVDTAKIERQSNITSVLGVINNLPGISINESDAFGGDDWSTSISMRGFTVNGEEQQLGMTIDGLPNGGSSYGGGAKANRYLDAENMSAVEVSQGTADISSTSLEALGGTFNFVSGMPSQKKATTFAYTGGDHDASRYFVRYDTGEIFGNTLAYASFSSTSADRWSGEGSNGGMERQHAELKFVSELSRLTMTGRISYDNADEDNYNAVTIEQFAQTPDWDQLTWNWTGVPHFDQMFAEGWSTLRVNTFAYLKFEYEINSAMSFQVTPYYHKNTGRGDWIPPFLVNAVDGEGNPTATGGTIDSQYGFTDKEGSALAPNAGCDDNLSWPWDSGAGLAPSCYNRDAVQVMSYRHTHYGKDRGGITADFDWSIGINDIKVGLWAESQIREESRDWHKVVDARIYHHFDENPYWTQYSSEYQTDTFKLYLQDTLTLGDFTFDLGVQQYLVEIEKRNDFTGEEISLNSDSDALFSAGGLYQVSDELHFFAGYSQNFSAIKDGVLDRGTANLENIEPETADNIDVGFRYTNDTVNFAMTFYTIRFDNRITFIAPGSDTGPIDYTTGSNGIYTNVGGVESQGVELSVSYRINENWHLYSSYTNNDSVYADDVIGYEPGATVIDSVQDMFVLSADYTNNNFRSGLSGKYTSDRGVAEAYNIVDFYVGYNVPYQAGIFESIDLAFVINNLTDEDYLSTGTGNGETFFIGAPRTATMTFTANF